MQNSDASQKPKHQTAKLWFWFWVGVITMSLWIQGWTIVLTGSMGAPAAFVGSIAGAFVGVGLCALQIDEWHNDI